MIRTGYILLISLSLTSLIIGQENLITNGGFESHLGFPVKEGDFSKVANWYNPSEGYEKNYQYGTPDYFHSQGKGDVKAPYTKMGTVFGYSGSAYIGLILYTDNDESLLNFREYISIKLKAPLEKGKKYQITLFYCNGMDNHYGKYSTENLGFRMSLDKIVQHKNNPINNDGAMKFPNIKFEIDWTKSSLTFIATKNAEYLTIGNFWSNEETIVRESNLSTSIDKFSYIFLDNIELISLDIEPSITELLEDKTDSVTVPEDTDVIKKESDELREAIEALEIKKREIEIESKKRRQEEKKAAEKILEEREQLERERKEFEKEKKRQEDENLKQKEKEEADKTIEELKQLEIENRKRRQEEKKAVEKILEEREQLERERKEFEEEKKRQEDEKKEIEERRKSEKEKNDKDVERTKELDAKQKLLEEEKAELALKQKEEENKIEIAKEKARKAKLEKERIAKEKRKLERSKRDQNFPREKQKMTTIEELEKIVLKGEALRLNLFFEADSFLIKDRHYAELDSVEKFILKNKEIVVEIGGHTNGLPKHAYCDDLSSKRARSIREFLIENGVPRDRIFAKGYGKRKPIASNFSDIGRAKNQRVEIKLKS